LHPLLHRKFLEYFFAKVGFSPTTSSFFGRDRHPLQPPRQVVNSFGLHLNVLGGIA
jgi:hypothetical protein